MMNYKEYHFHDLARDPYFRRWVLERDSDAERFWARWVMENPGEEKKIQAAKTFLLALREKDTDLSDAQLDRITQNVIAQDRPPARKIPLIRVAASVALLLLAGLGYYIYSLKTGTAQGVAGINDVILDDFREVSNTTGALKKVTLADGSIVTLYPKSRVKFSKDFNRSERTVYLTGQAFFEVVKNAQKPFWVYTEDISTQVVGTSFMVKAFEGAREINVEVKKGKVLVYTRKDLKTAQKGQKNTLPGMMISSNQKVSFSKNEEKLVKSIIEEPEKIEKIDESLFRLEEVPVSVVFARIEKAYGIPINYDAQSMAECYVTANLEGDALFRKLDLICKITRSSYEIADGQIIVYSKGCF
ncbi:FecR family protein [Leadbetterella sp. DM7]|uniref:FecR family protein n=1 Tax=Leadbetterella sp. DM7 TaxID=3235085 RepID=UPI00349EA8B5